MIILVTWTRFCALLILEVRNVHAVLCHLFRCFDPRFKENIHCHPVFIIRNNNSCRKDYLKDRLKSRESDHFNIQFVIPTQRSQTLRHVLRSGMICGGFCKKSVSYNTYGSDSSSWISNGLVSSCFDNC